MGSEGVPSGSSIAVGCSKCVKRPDTNVPWIISALLATTTTMPPKRKRAQADDDDEEKGLSGNQALPIADLPKDFSGEPEDGMQYLFLVR